MENKACYNCKYFIDQSHRSNYSVTHYRGYCNQFEFIDEKNIPTNMNNFQCQSMYWCKGQHWADVMENQLERKGW